MQTTNDSNLNNKLSAIDKALAAAKARKAMKTGDDSETQPSAPSAQMKQKAEKTLKPTSEEKTAVRSAKDADRENRRLQRAKERDERRATRLAEKGNKGPAHMKKVANAAAKLPILVDQATFAVNEITTNFSRDQIAAIALHLQHFNRVKATERALGQQVSLGQEVRIIGGDPRFIGKVGTTSLVRRIRCFVDIPGVKKPVYLFTSDVEIVEPAAKTGTAG
jgi:hypothetical protein